MAAHLDPSVPLPERILAALARHTSRRPARADDILAQVGGDAAAAWGALETLVAERRIGTAHLHRPQHDPEPWLAIWPTGVRVASGGWTGGSHSGLFVRHAQPLHHALRAASTPRAAPPRPDHEAPDMPDPPTAATAAHPHRRPGALEAAVCELLAGRGADDALAVRELAERLGTSDENARQAVRRLAQRGVLADVERPGRNGHAMKAYYLAAPLAGAAAPHDQTPAAEAPHGGTPAPVGAIVAPQPAGPALGADTLATLVRGLMPEPEPEPALEPEPCPSVDDDPLGAPAAPATAPAGLAPTPPAGREPARIEFALWDDGRLSLYDGDQLLQLAAADTRRLAALLGVPLELAMEVPR